MINTNTRKYLLHVDELNKKDPNDNILTYLFEDVLIKRTHSCMFYLQGWGYNHNSVTPILQYKDVNDSTAQVFSSQ